jgi:hypothetical protein
MTDEPTSRRVRLTRNAREAFLRDLAVFAAERWESRFSTSGAPDYPLPEAAVLEVALSACYQASLLREEEQPVRFAEGH